MIGVGKRDRFSGQIFPAAAQTAECILPYDVDVQLIHVLTHQCRHVKCIFFIFKHTHTERKCSTRLKSAEQPIFVLLIRVLDQLP